MDEGLLERKCMLAIDINSLYAERFMFEQKSDILLETQSNSSEKNGSGFVAIIRRIWDAVRSFFEKIKDKLLGKEDTSKMISKIKENINDPLFKSYELDVKYLNAETLKELSDVSNKARKICEKTRNLKPLSASEKRWLEEVDEKMANGGIEAVFKAEIRKSNDIKKVVTLCGTVLSVGVAAGGVALGIHSDKEINKYADLYKNAYVDTTHAATAERVAAKAAIEELKTRIEASNILNKLYAVLGYNKFNKSIQS